MLEKHYNTRMNQPQPQTAPITLPDIPAVAINARQAALLTTDGEIRILKHDQAAQELNKQSVLLCHAPYTTQTLDLKDINPFDLLELFAFVHPAKFCVPTPVGLATALGLAPPTSFDDYGMRQGVTVRFTRRYLASQSQPASYRPCHGQTRSWLELDAVCVQCVG